MTLGRDPNEHVSRAEIWGNRCKKENEGPRPQGGNKVSLFQKTDRGQSVTSRAVSCRKKPEGSRVAEIGLEEEKESARINRTQDVRVPRKRETFHVHITSGPCHLRLGNHALRLSTFLKPQFSHLKHGNKLFLREYM